ncbi:MAG: hypothetical protein ACKPKO_48365, partial [Candidatus Fonsibacter sp.]
MVKKSHVLEGILFPLPLFVAAARQSYSAALAQDPAATRQLPHAGPPQGCGSWATFATTVTVLRLLTIQPISVVAFVVDNLLAPLVPPGLLGRFPFSWGN